MNVIIFSRGSLTVNLTRYGSAAFLSTVPKVLIAPKVLTSPKQQQQRRQEQEQHQRKWTPRFIEKYVTQML